MVSKENLFIFGLTVIILFSFTAAADAQSLRDRTPTEEELDALGLYDFTPLEWDFSGVRPGQSFSLDVELDGEVHTLLLMPKSVRSPWFTLKVQGEDGQLREVVPPESMTYRGVVRGAPDSAVTASFVDGRFYASVSLRPYDCDLWYIQPRSPGEDAPTDEYAVYNSYEAKFDPTWTDMDLEVPDQANLTPQGNPSPLAGPPTGYFYLTEIAFDADVEFYNKNSNSVANTVADIESIVNGMALIYERDVAITWEVTEIIVRTAEPDPYGSTGPSNLLNQLVNEWLVNQKSVVRDVAHLMTGKNLDGSTIGVGYVKVVCGAMGYALSQSRFTTNYKQRVTLTAHEVGHNYGCNGHCDALADCYIMCSGLGGCDGVGLPNFGPWSINKITLHADSRTCLDLVEATATISINAGVGQNELEVAVSPPDENGEAEGVVPFTRKYLENTLVTLTAPLEYDFVFFLYRFKEWKLDGVSQAYLQNSIEISSQFIEAFADYAQARKLAVTSGPVPVNVTLTPNDLDNMGSGQTPFKAVYFADTTATVEAPLAAGRYVFIRWIVNGEFEPYGQNVVNVPIVAYGACTAHALYYFNPIVVSPVPLGFLVAPSPGAPSQHKTIPPP